ncbi:MAG: hypothetical protein CBD62_03315 [Candidatus Pelagibacter sp. TMED202]|nr:MAG: hypothetical protein CBD62_03315 [Candidatus Pelagibacter sp. TMED202]|tara:strand:- start:1118 stop:1498 length:381 start_codon:yes stop_codon:yes gene_type:complete
MKKVYTETSVGDIIDKLTILEIKKKKISKKAHLTQINKEYSSLKNTLKKNVRIDTKVKKLWKNLYITNLKIWEMENFKRESQKQLEKIAKVASGVYKSNDDRAEIKLKINKLTGSNIREVKKYSKY